MSGSSRSNEVKPVLVLSRFKNWQVAYIVYVHVECRTKSASGATYIPSELSQSLMRERDSMAIRDHKFNGHAIVSVFKNV